MMVRETKLSFIIAVTRLHAFNLIYAHKSLSLHTLLNYKFSSTDYQKHVASHFYSTHEDEAMSL